MRTKKFHGERLYKGRRVVESLKGLYLSISLDDIENATNDDDNCVLVWAVKGLTRGVLDVHIWDCVAYIQYAGDDFWTRYIVPPSVKAQLDIFDESVARGMRVWSGPTRIYLEAGITRSREKQRDEKARNGYHRGEVGSKGRRRQPRPAWKRQTLQETLAG
jgi:hypothetical protein